MKTFDEIVLEYIDIPPIELIHEIFHQKKVIRHLEETIKQLEKDLEESRACEDPVLVRECEKMKWLTSWTKPENVAPLIAEYERKFGIPMEELEEEDEDYERDKQN